MQDHATPKLCECGCGTPAPIATATWAKYGYVRGQPVRFLRGHSHAKWNKRPEYVVESETGCWVWQRGRNQAGYGVHSSHSVQAMAHRVYYVRAKGEIPAGTELDHLCRNRLCVNPDHLDPVSRAVNVQRGNSAKLTPDQVREIRALQGVRGGPRVAHEFGVCRTAIYAIWSGLTWKNVD